MKHPIDHIFNQHLQQYEVHPSVDAWERLNESLRKKKEQKIKLWYSIAASLLVVGISSFIILSKQPSGTQSFTNDAAISEIEKTVLPEKPSPEESVPVIIEKSKTNTSKDDALAIIKAVKPKQENQANQKVQKEQLSEIPQKLENLQASISSDLHISNDVKMIAAVGVIPSENAKSNTIFDKITNTALEIKNSNGVMAEIRQFKDEVISLEFFKTKKSI